MMCIEFVFRYLNTESPSFILSAVRRRRRQQPREIMSIKRNLFTVPYYSTISVPNSCCPGSSTSENNSSQASKKMLYLLFNKIDNISLLSMYIIQRITYKWLCKITHKTF